MPLLGAIYLISVAIAACTIVGVGTYLCVSDRHRGWDADDIIILCALGVFIGSWAWPLLLIIGVVYLWTKADNDKIKEKK